MKRGQHIINTETIINQFEGRNRTKWNIKELIKVEPNDSVTGYRTRYEVDLHILGFD